MRKYGLLFFILVTVGAWGYLFRSEPGLAKAPKKGKLLYLTLTAGFKHDSVPLSREIVKEIGDKSGAFQTTWADDVTPFTADNLKNFDAVMFNTTGELPMADEQKKALLDFIRSGHGFVGVHSATDTFYKWPEYGELLGGYFDGHPWNQEVTMEVTDPRNDLVGFLGKTLRIKDEIYQTRDFRAASSRVLLKVDPKSVDLEKKGVHQRDYGWPMAWTRTYGKGRVYYNALGHYQEVWRDTRFQEMLLKGIKWAMKQTK